MNRNQPENRNGSSVERVHKGADTRDLDDVIDKTLRPKKRLSFFERQTALALGKTLDANGNIDLSIEANQTSYRGNGRQNRNAQVRPSPPAMIPIEGKSAHISIADFPEGAYAVHARRCKTASGADVQGKNCVVCGGIGWHAYIKLRTEKAQGSVNQPRHEMPNPTNGPQGSYAPAE